MSLCGLLVSEEVVDVLFECCGVVVFFLVFVEVLLGELVDEVGVEEYVVGGVFVGVIGCHCVFSCCSHHASQ